MKNLFITAAGTEVGKTFVTGLLTHQLRAQDRTVRALKPLITGYTDEIAHGSDTHYLLDAMGLPVNAETIACVSPWRFEAPLSPNMAARREGRRIDLGELIAFCNAARRGAEEYLLIEGVGGVMVPLNDQCTVRDWIMALDIPALLVTGSYLGSISHTLTAAEALQSKGITVAGIIVSESIASPVPLAETLETLTYFTKGVRVCGLPRVAGLGYAPDLAYLLECVE